MFVKYISAGLAASAMLASVAFAQNPATPSDRPSTAAATTTSDSSFQGTWRSSKLVGLSVYNDANESIGSVYELLADKSGNIKGVVIGVGGFLGVGEHLVAVAFDKVKWVTEPVANTGTASATRPASTTTTTTGAASTTTPTTAPAAPASSTATTSTTPATAVKANPWYPDHAVYNATKDELKAMPEFKYNS
jgi:sporulation protein YlmC with PRC-barrel domain